MVGILSLLWVCLSVCLSVCGASPKSTNFGSSYLVDGLSEGDEIRQLDRGVLPIPVPCCTSPPRLVNFGPGGPPGPQKSEGVKIVRLFSYTVCPTATTFGVVRGIGA